MQPTVLIVDDDRAHLLALSRLLQANGYKAVTADDGEEALVLFEEHAPDVVLLDAVMPGLDGLEVCTRLRALPEGDTVPIVILTSLEDEASIDRYFAGGATDYIIKPIRLKLLLHRIRVLARMRMAERERHAQARLFERFCRAHPLPSVILKLPEGEIVEVNDSFLRVGQISREAVVGKRTDELPAFTDPAGRAQAMNAVQEGKTPFAYETRLALPDRELEVLVIHERFELDGQPYSLVVLIDITRRKLAEREALEGKLRLEELTSRIPGVVYQYRRQEDGKEQFDFINTGAETFFGVSPEAFYADGEKIWTFIHPDDLPAMQEAAEQAWQERSPWRYEFRVIAKDGTERWGRLQSHPRAEPDGTIVWNGILIDDTERRTIELDLAETTRLLNEVTASMPGVVYRHRQLKDGSQSFDYISDGTESLFGVKPEVVRRDAGALWAAIVEEDQGRLEESIWHTFNTLTPWRHEFHLRLPSGEDRWISGQSVSFKPDDDTLLCTGVMTDITDRKRMEATLRENERRFTRFFLSIPIPAIIFDFDTKTIVDANEAWEAAMGFTRAEAIGRTTADLGIYLDPSRRAEVWKVIFQGETPYNYECEFRTKQGAVRVGDVLADCFEANGRKYVISLIRDVTEQRRIERDLQESREKFEKFFHTTSLPCSIHSFATEKILEVNQAMEKLIGFSREEVIGQTTLDLNFFVNPEDRVGLWERFRSVEGQVAGEYPFRIKSGEIRIGTMTGSRFEVGGEQYLFTIVQDVTEQRRAERESREQKEKFVKFFHATSHACSIQSFKTEQLVEVNDAMLRLTGFTREEMLGRTSQEGSFYVNPEDRAAVWSACREGRLPYHAQIDFRIKGGEIRTGEAMVGTFEVGGEPYFFSIIQDVTERKRMEAALRENEARFSKFFETTPLPAMMVDVETRQLVAGNQAFFAQTGFRPEDVLGKTSRNLDLYVDETIYETVWRRIEARDMPYLYEAEFRISSGEKRLGSVAVEMFEAGGRWHAMSIFHDITDQRELEAERLRVAKLDGLNLLAGGVAHDFNNLLAAVLGNIELLQTQFGSESDALTTRLNAIERAGKRAKSLAAQLLMLARDIEPLAETVGLPSVIMDAMTFIVRDTPVNLEFDFPEAGLPLVLADPTQIEQVFQNLAVNACDAMPEGGVLHVVGSVVTVRDGDAVPLPPGDYAKITVTDTGGGIMPEAVSRIFDPYFTTKKNGSGLGLALVHSIMTKHHGHVRVSSMLGVGTTFELFFPCLPKTYQNVG